MDHATRLFLVRHGESHGNVNKALYTTTPDHQIQLTDLGREQARQAGRFIHQLVPGQPIQFYSSPHARAHQTLDEIIKALPATRIRILQDPRLREQEWGMLQPPEERYRQEGHYEAYGRFFYRFSQGESGADVYDRISSFLDSLWRELRKPDAPPNFCLVTHGLAVKSILMRWFHLNTDVFERLHHPANGQVIVLERTATERHFSIRDLPIPKVGLTSEDLQRSEWLTTPAA